jgi:hypothetical protein
LQLKEKKVKLKVLKEQLEEAETKVTVSDKELIRMKKIIESNE